MNKRYKQFWATIGGVGFLAVFFESFPSLLKSVDYFLQSRQLTIGAILMGSVPFFVVLSTIRKESEKRKRQELIERRQLQIAFNVNEILEALKVESKWSLQEIGSPNTVQTNLRDWSKLRLQLKGVIRMIANILKANLSKKLISALVSILVVSLNQKFGLNLSENTVDLILGLSLAHISLQTIIDSIKAYVSNKYMQTTKLTIDQTATYSNTYSTIKEVHDGINLFLKLARQNDTVTLAAYGPLLSIIKSAEQATPVKEPEAEVIESQVPA